MTGLTKYIFGMLIYIFCPIYLVMGLKVENVTANSISVKWNMPNLKYTVWISLAVNDSYTTLTLNVTGSKDHTFERLDPYRNYTIGIFLSYQFGNGSKVRINQATDSSSEAFSTLKIYQL